MKRKPGAMLTAESQAAVYQKRVDDYVDEYREKGDELLMRMRRPIRKVTGMMGPSNIPTLGDECPAVSEKRYVGRSGRRWSGEMVP